VLWPPSASMDAVKYELTIRSWSDQAGEGGVVSTQTVTLGTVPFGQATVSGLTTGERYTARVTAIDRSGNRGAESDRSIFQALEFFDLHNTKKTVQEKRIAIEGTPQALGWCSALSTMEELTELRTRIAWFNNRSVEDKSSLGGRLAYYLGFDTWGYGGYIVDTAWHAVIVPTPNTIWVETPGWVTESAAEQVADEVNRVTEWSPAQSGDWQINRVKTWDGFSEFVISEESWADCWSQTMANWRGPYESVYDGVETPFPSQVACGFYGGAGWVAPLYWQVGAVHNCAAEVSIEFNSRSGVSGFFWTDYGGASPGAEVTKYYPFGNVYCFADPATSPRVDNWGGMMHLSSGYDGRADARYNIYARSSRSLQLVDVVITPDSEYVAVGAAVGVDAFVIYKSAGWDGAALNGRYDLGETFTDSDGDGIRDPDEGFTDEDAVFCYIPTPIECGDQNAFVCNQGGSIFVGFDPGTYTITTPQGGSGKINILGVNIEFTDTASNTLNWQDEDLYGGLTPVNDALNQDMSTVNLSAILPPDVTGTFTIRTGPDIELWKGGAPFLAANSALAGLPESQITGAFQIKGISVTAESGITLEFWPDGVGTAQYADYVKVWTVQVAIENVTTTATGSPLHVLETLQIATKEWLSGLPATFNVGKDKLVDSIGAVVWSKCPYLVVKALNVSCAGGNFVAAGALFERGRTYGSQSHAIAYLLIFIAQ